MKESEENGQESGDAGIDESVVVKECVFTVGVTIDCGRQRDDSKERLCLGARGSMTLAMAIEKNLKKEISTE